MREMVPISQERRRRLGEVFCFSKQMHTANKSGKSTSISLAKSSCHQVQLGCVVPAKLLTRGCKAWAQRPCLVSRRVWVGPESFKRTDQQMESMELIANL